MLNLRDILTVMEMEHTQVDKRGHPSWATSLDSPQTMNHFIDAKMLIQHKSPTYFCRHDPLNFFSDISIIVKIDTTLENQFF